MPEMSTPMHADSAEETRLLLKRLCWARVPCWVLIAAPNAAEAVRRERQVSALSLPAEIKVLTSLPATLGLTLRHAL